ncbi:MAG: 16S rRNA (adenine(1518)-N(6)/adenine(1519)-N(6))-dimethyltransferase RsmA [Acutalibacteraceae bacterium]|nr:16S rRNA (adenine(1518)-N(6)/adenine(1519)-N(6))-dimethyltransferase RsmA [Acutalibacteraceae bacterium]
MQNLSDISVVKDLLNRHGFKFSKALGQNFLINPTVCPRMAEACGADENTGVIEVGPGFGVLTAELAKRAKKVVSIELDERLLPVLDETLAEFDNVEVINSDVLKVDLHKLIEEKFSDMKVAVCANLPYYITSPVIMHLLESKLPVENITVMVQKEAAQRLCAPVGSRDAGAVTVAVDYYADAEKIFDVSAGSFMPAPKVDSSVIRLNVRKQPPIDLSDEKLFFRMVKAVFAQRRKIAANSISAGMSLPKETVYKAIEAAGYSDNVRAESFTLNELASLANEIFTVTRQ